MLGKCANPLCHAQLRYLHEGKLFVVYSGASFAISSDVEYAWLCGSCCHSMTVPNGREILVGASKRGTQAVA